jgi:hypothetical protein
MRPETVWTFKTARFTVILHIEEDYSYQYDGDDPDGETQAALDAGDCIAFDSIVRVFMNTKRGPVELGADSLGGSVYDAGKAAEFWTAHRDPNPMGRNCSIMRAWHKAKTDHETSICHYFPEMVRTAIAEARKTLAEAPHLRAA